MVINDLEDFEFRGFFLFIVVFLLFFGGFFEGLGIVYLWIIVNLLNIMIFDKFVINMLNIWVMNIIFKIVNFMVKIFRV